MSDFKVKEVVDGDTFSVVNGWKWDGKTGDFVRPLGYNTPEQGEPGYLEAKTKLKNLIEGKQVDIRKAVSVDKFGRLLSEVYYNNINLAEYFKDHRI